MSETLEGGCFCGNVRYRVPMPSASACFCHCESCRRAAGAPYVAWFTVALGNFVVTGGTPTEHASSPGVSRGFCARCGTSLTYRHAARPGEIDVTVATLDDPSRIVPDRHIWLSDKLPWLRINDGLPQYQRFTSDG